MTEHALEVGDEVEFHDDTIAQGFGTGVKGIVLGFDMLEGEYPRGSGSTMTPTMLRAIRDALAGWARIQLTAPGDRLTQLAFDTEVGQVWAVPAKYLRKIEAG